MSKPTTFLPLEKFHIVPLKGISPDEIKKSAKKTQVDREPIKHNTKLNAIVKFLGFNGGFSAYKEKHFNDLKLFFKKNNLENHQDLISHRNTGYVHSLWTRTPSQRQDISERLFFHNGFPKRIFTGYNFKFNEIFDEVQYIDQYFPRILNENGYDISYLSSKDENDEINFFKKNGKDRISFEIDGLNISCYVLDLYLFKHKYILTYLYHYNGDNLCDLESSETHDILMCYWRSKKSSFYNKERQDYERSFYAKLLKLLKYRLLFDEYGWVNIIKYNDNLIFITDNKGNYDFLIKNQRGYKFNHEIYNGNLKCSDIPSFIDDYSFSRWYYFDFKGNRKLNSHYSELNFYENHGDEQYPGSTTILKCFLEKKGEYTPYKKKSKKLLPGFKNIMINNKSLMVSDLISINELIDFQRNNEDYFSYRNGDSLNKANSDDDRTLPASVTYYDALSYINWMESKNKVQFRLLTIDEYLSLRETSEKEIKELPFVNIKLDNEMEFKKDGVTTLISVLPNFNAEDGYLTFSKEVKYITKSNIKFINANLFAEWLHSELTIRSKDLRSFQFDRYLKVPSLDASSTGQYKATKIGFRLCYELDN